MIDVSTARRATDLIRAFVQPKWPTALASNCRWIYRPDDDSHQWRRESPFPASSGSPYLALRINSKGYSACQWPAGGAPAPPPTPPSPSPPPRSVAASLPSSSSPKSGPMLHDNRAYVVVQFSGATSVRSWCLPVGPWARPSGRRGTRTPKRTMPPPVFKTGSRAPTEGWSRPDAFHVPISSGGWNRTNGLLTSEPGVTTSSNYPGSFSYNDTLLLQWFASSCGGRSRTCGPVVQSHVFLPTETTPQSGNERDGRDSNPRPGA